MKKIFTLLLSVCLFTAVMAQQSATIKKTEVAPIVDGTIDDVWATVEPIALETPHGTETPTVGESWWKMLWNDDGLFLLTFIEDDKFVPAYLGTHPNENWMYDKLEIYFDVNYEKKDGKGAKDGSGHYQVAPTVKQALLEGGATAENRGEVWAYNCSDDPKYYVEYFFPFSMLLDKDGNEVDKTSEIGFDVNIMDNDMADFTRSRNRMNWSNAGAINENWSNMDDAGLITLEGAVGIIDISSITIAGGTAITTDNGTLQLTTTLAPADATQAYKWQITNETGRVTVSKTGLVTAQRNGTVKIKAVSADDFVSSNEITLTISGQKVSLAEANIILNGFFKNGADGMENWGNAGGAGSVGDGYYNLTCTPKADIWSTMFGQGNVKVADATTKYIFKFKAKASADMVVPTLFEDRGNGNDKVLTSSAPYRDNGYGKWDVPVTTEEQWFEMDVTFSNWKENSAYELNFQAGKLDGIFSIDSVMLFTEADYALVDPTVGVKIFKENSMKVYPNPVSNTLYVDLKAINSKVAIYNSVGQKLMEKTATGNRVQFDVSALRKGMYFVKLEDGSTRKFVK